MDCGFYFEIIAPNGLEVIKPQVDSASLGLYVYISGFNNKGILKNRIDSEIEMGMDSSTTELMYGSGHIEGSFENAKEKMKVLTNIFKSAELPHKIGIDDENGEKSIWYTYNYS